VLIAANKGDAQKNGRKKGEKSYQIYREGSEKPGDGPAQARIDGNRRKINEKNWSGRNHQRGTALVGEGREWIRPLNIS